MHFNRVFHGKKKQTSILVVKTPPIFGSTPISFLHISSSKAQGFERPAHRGVFRCIPRHQVMPRIRGWFIKWLGKFRRATFNSQIFLANPVWKVTILWMSNFWKFMILESDSIFNTNNNGIFFSSVGGLVAMKNCPGSVNRFEEWPNDYITLMVKIDDLWNEPWLWFITMIKRCWLPTYCIYTTNSTSTRIRTWQMTKLFDFFTYFLNVTFQITTKPSFATFSMMNVNLLYSMSCYTFCLWKKMSSHVTSDSNCP